LYHQHNRQLANRERKSRKREGEKYKERKKE